MPGPALVHRDLRSDWLSVLELGVVADGQDERNWNVISDHCALLRSAPADDCSHSMCGTSRCTRGGGPFEAPRFAVPALGLRDATIGEVCLAADAYLDGEPSLDMAYFGLAVAAGQKGDLEEAEELWRYCLEADAMEAHYGLGYTLLGLGRPHEAYRHLRYYPEITPQNAWACSWRGQAPTRSGTSATRDAAEWLDGLRPSA